jgi:tetratricopeptide (TPR) repeat protein
VNGPEQLAKGERAEAIGDYVAAAAAYSAVTGASDETLAADAYFRLGRISWRQGRFSAALAAFDTALALAERAQNVELCARVQNGIGAAHYAGGAHPAARRAYAGALARTSDPVMRAKIVLNLGVIQNIEGNLADAHEHYERAFRLFTEHGDTASATLALHNRGMVEADLARWNDADASFLAALALATDAENGEMIAKTLVNRSEVLLQRGAVMEAIEHCDSALKIYARVGDEVGRGEGLRWRAQALERTGDLAAAERNASEALQIAMRCGARLLEAETSRHLGMLRGQLGAADAAQKLLRRALSLFTELGARREAEEVEQLLPRSST